LSVTDRGIGTNAAFLICPPLGIWCLLLSMHEPAGAGPTAQRTAGLASGTVAPILIGAAAASLGAGLVHAAAAGTHAGADTLVMLFAVTAAAQVGWAAVVVLRPHRLVLTGGVLLNGGALAAWAFSRTTGLPWPAELEAVEEVSTQDVIAAALGVVAAAGALLAILRASLRAPRRGPVPRVALLAGGVALVLAVPGMAAEHGDGPSHDHGHGGEAGEVAADHPHTGDDAVDHAHADELTTASAAATGPIISLDDARVTDAQRAGAQSLIDTTRAGMARFTDVASVEAAGYLSIGDSPTGYEHFINVGYIADGIELDPERIESIVFTVAPDGTRALGSAMYILQFGKTMADVPDVAGELTTWHDHQNLCWDGAQVVGTTDRTGSCERGVFRATPPMLHVWMIEHPCGPFAGIEGAHGAGCGTHGH
jgi:hypothetical protein